MHPSRKPGTHFQGVGPVVVLGLGKIHELIDQQAAAGRVGPETQLPVDHELAQPEGTRYSGSRAALGTPPVIIS